MGKNYEGRENLQKVLGTKDIVALAFGTIVGGGWVLLADSWTASAGALALGIAYVLAAVVCIFIGLTYAELTPALPMEGGEMVYAYRAMGYKGGYITAWLLTLTYTGIVCWVGVAFAKALNYLIDIPHIVTLWEVGGTPVYLSWVIISIVGTIAMCILNYYGLQSSTKMQNVMTVLLAIIGMTLAVGGFTAGSITNYNPPITSFKAMFIVILATPAMYAGFNIIPQAAEEMDVPRAKIGKILVFSIIVVGIWYALIMFSVGFLATPGEYATKFTKLGVIEAFKRATGSDLLSRVIVVGVLFGLLTTWNGFILGASRLFYSMSRAKMLPSTFSKLDEKHKTPTAAIALVGVFGCVAPFAGPKILGWLIDAESFAMVCAYLSVSVSFMLLRKNEPDLERPFKLKHGNVIGVISVILSVIFILLYFPVIPGGGLVWQEWVIVILWMLFGIVMMYVNKHVHSDVTEEERDYLMFGKDFLKKPKK